MHLTQLRECAWTRLQNVTKAQLRSAQHYFDRRTFDANLATLVDAASGHDHGHSLSHDRLELHAPLGFHFLSNGGWGNGKTRSLRRQRWEFSE